MYSGLKINEEKTDVHLLYRNDTALIRIKIGNIWVNSKNEINGLGVTFDSKLKGSNHVS